MATDAHTLARIHARMQAGDVAGARNDIDRLVAQDPADAAAWHLAGVIRRRAGDNASAAEALNRAIGCGLCTAEVWNSLGLAREDTDDLTGAIEAYEAAERADPVYLPAIANLGRALSLAGEHDRAIACLDAAMQRSSSSALIINGLAAAHSDAGNHAQAEALYRRTLELDPTNRVAAIRLGQCLRDRARVDEAVVHFRARQAQFAGSPEYLDAMAGALIEAGLRSEAETLLEHVCDTAPAYFPAHRALARLAREYSTGADGYRSYRAMAAKWPQEPSIWHDWLAVMMRYRDHEEALTVIGQAERLLGASDHLTRLKAAILSETGEPVAAEEIFGRLPDQGLGGLPATLIARARNALILGDAELAESLSSRAIAQSPDDQFGWAYRGLAWRLLGDEREFWLFDYERQVQQHALAALSDSARLAELNAVLRERHTATGHPPDQSLRGGTQTEGALFQRADPAIRALRDAIEAEVRRYIGAMPDDADHPFYRRKRERFRFAGSWSVRLTQAGFHIAHIHQEGWISSALHLVVPPVQPDEDSDAGSLVLGSPPTELGLNLPPRRVVTPRAGHLVLFPSSMWHATLPFAGGAERLTVAFDIVPI